MATVTLDPGKLGARLIMDQKGAPKAVQRALFSALHRGRSFIVKKTPVDRGILRNAWKVIRLSQGAELVNDQPYAGIMERGARPFKMSPIAIWYLKAWVMRRLKAGDITPEGAQTRITWKKGWDKKLAIAKGESLIKSARRKRFKNSELEEQAERIAYAIAKHFERVGMRGRYFVMQSLPKMADLMEAEIQRSLSRFFNRGR